MTEDYTTIAISKATHEQLERYKIHEEDTFETAVNRLLRFEREGL